MKCTAFFVITIGVLSFSAQAFNFTLSQGEFNTWDERCKKAYSASGAGRSSGFYGSMTPQQNKEALLFGEEAGGAWHYCAGLILLQRASLASGQEREGHLKRALSEIRFTVNKIKPEHQWYPEIHIDYARAHYVAGQKAEAFNLLNRLINTHPNNSLPYTALAYYLKREQQLEQAISVLQSAPEILLNESAELNYFLGWYLMDKNQLELAVVHAKRAYALNYPIPALRNRLAAKGFNW